MNYHTHNSSFIEDFTYVITRIESKAIYNSNSVFERVVTIFFSNYNDNQYTEVNINIKISGGKLILVYREP